MNSYKRKLMVKALGFLVLTQNTPTLGSDAPLKRGSAEEQDSGLPAKKIAHCTTGNLSILEAALKNNSIHTLDELPSLLQTLPKQLRINFITEMLDQYLKESEGPTA